MIDELENKVRNICFLKTNIEYQGCCPLKSGELTGDCGPVIRNDMNFGDCGTSSPSKIFVGDCQLPQI